MARSKKRLKPLQNAAAARPASKASESAEHKASASQPVVTLKSLMLKFGAALAVIVVSGVAHGLWTERWQNFSATAVAAERLQRLPMTVGDWDAVSSEIDAEVLVKAGIVGYIVRDYVNRQTGSVVSLMVVCGRPGPISVHTPDICFRGRGYRFTVDPERRAIALPDSDGAAEFWTATPVRDSGGVPEHLRVLWSWIADGPCLAPDNPRITFASHQALYKLYVTRQVNSPDEPFDDDCAKFIRLVIPQLHGVLFSSDQSD